ncbi:MAG: RAMP superfamily CRISPR-associated protein [Coleofasciculaceae cyanobacterium]
MQLAKALQKAIAQKGDDINIPFPPNEDNDDNDGNDWEPTNPEQVPMMYRAQVQGRCSLQYAKKNEDLNRWTEEWVYPNPDPKQEQTPYYQYAEPKLGLDGLVYRLKVEFPFRVFTNCGQDSILRPSIGKNGIPFVPGSGIKGLFERLSRHPQVSEELQQKVKKYCGSPEEQGILRFHGAYPVGDWAGTKTVQPKNRQAETRYRLVDVVHPQQQRQVEGKGSPKAIAVVSLFQPTFVFELSSIKPLPEDEWQTIAGLLRRALRPGLGGKTSTGYGLCFIPQDRYPLDITLKGKGVSPLLRSDEPEFRPNLFKASLKGHVLRLLAGVSKNDKDVHAKVNRLFGHTTEPGVLQLYWASKLLDYGKQGREETPIYETKGTLYLDAPKQDLPFVQKVIEFAVTMGGFGKSWRRVWHRDFFPDYKTRAIGCHWVCQDSSFEPTRINSPNDLKAFLNELRQTTISYMKPKANSAQYLSWKEAWCPQRLSVHSQVVSKSQAIRLFHDEIFKTTPAIGGRELDDERPKFVSCVWHRMLPIADNQYLEIVTLFHGGNSANSPGLKEWRRQGENQFPLFVQRLKESGFTLTWPK